MDFNIEKGYKFLENKTDLDVIINYIIDNFNNSIKNLLDELLFLSKKVAEVHGPSHKELIEVYNIFIDFDFLIKNSFKNNEQDFFPIISDKNINNNKSNILDFIEKDKKINDKFLINLEKISNLTDNYKIPKDACKTYTRLLVNLFKLDSYLIDYIKIKNKILYPLLLSKLENL